MTSHENHCISNRCQFDCFFINLYMIMTKKTLHYWPVDQWVPSQWASNVESISMSRGLHVYSIAVTATCTIYNVPNSNSSYIFWRYCILVSLNYSQYLHQILWKLWYGLVYEAPWHPSLRLAPLGPMGLAVNLACCQPGTEVYVRLSGGQTHQHFQDLEWTTFCQML